MSFISIEDLERGEYDEICTINCILNNLSRDGIMSELIKDSSRTKWSLSGTARLLFQRTSRC